LEESRQNLEWFTKDRSETATNRMEDRTLNNISVLNPALGINVYRNVFSEDTCKNYISILEKNLSSETDNGFFWNKARVTNSSEADTYARNAEDFKIRKNAYGPRNEQNAELYDLHEEIFRNLKTCVDDYGSYWGVGISYYEAFNFVKYEGTGTHFRVHADHGPTYVATISAVIYLNDNYDGGEITFPRFDLKIKPNPGDIVIFPSTFIYEHSSEPIQGGTKYSVVVMTDYNDRGGVNQTMPQVIQDYKLMY